MQIVEIKFHKITDKDTEVVSRVDIHFDGFWLKGFKVVRDPVTKKEYLTPPSYRSPLGWRALFNTDDPAVWRKICASVLSSYDEQLMKESADETQETQPYK
jgi:hypothetical protein